MMGEELELKSIFDKITKKIAEEEDNAIAKAFTMHVANLLNRNGIKPILTKVEAPFPEISNGNEYRIVSRYGYMFEKLDTSDHDKQIRDEVIVGLKTELIDIIQGNEEFIDWQKEEICLCLECAIENIVEKMKREQNE